MKIEQLLTDGALGVVASHGASFDVQEGSPVYGYRIVARIANFSRRLSSDKMKFMIYYDNQTKQSNIFSIFSVI